MSHAETPSYPPANQSEQALGSLAANWFGFTSNFWDDVHQEAQAKFALLEQVVRPRLASVRATAGRTAGRSFILFSHKTFSIDDERIDPVVAGITFSQLNNGVELEAEISGEQTGDTIFLLPKIVVPAAKQDLLEAARELAGRLANSADAVVKALQDASRQRDE